MTAVTDFIPAIGDLRGLPTDQNHINVKWASGDVWFSYSRRGEAISMHFSAGKSWRRQIRLAANQFCEWIFLMYPWCRMILAIIGPKSVVKLASSCGFLFVASRNGRTYMARVRQ